MTIQFSVRAHCIPFATVYVQLISAAHQMPHTIKTREEKQSKCEHSLHLVPKIGMPGGKPLSPRPHGVVIQQTTGNHTYYCYRRNYTQQGPRRVFHLRMCDGKWQRFKRISYSFSYTFGDGNTSRRVW